MNRLLESWQWNAASAALIAILALAFAGLWKFHRPDKPAFLLAAMALFILCFFSPVAVLSQHYLFSAHMAVHVLLLLVAGPLLVLALPENLPAFLTPAAKLIRVHPWLGWATGVGVMWLWHVPALFNAMMMHGSAMAPLLHFTESASLIVAGMMFSYPLLGAARNIHPLAGVLYLGTACICCSLLGLLITFAPAGVFHHYLSMHDAYGLNRLIRNDWQLTQEADRQAAGLIMWVPCCMIYVAGSLVLLRQWFGEKDVHAALNSFSKKSTL